MKVVKWERATLSSVSIVFTDGDWIESKDQSLAGIRLIQTGNVGIGEFKDRAEKARYISAETFHRLKCEELYGGDCLISRLPDPVGRACIIPPIEEQLITAVDCTIVRFDAGKICPDFFRYFSQSAAYLADVESACTGATRKRISRSKLGEVSVPLPPLDEQKRIVAILDEAFEGIDTAIANAEKNLANARELLDSYRNSAFTQKNKGWVEKDLSELIDIQSGFAFKSQDYRSNGHFLIRIGNVQSGNLSLDNPKYVALDKATLRFALREGDILTSLTGNIGRVAVVEVSHLPAALNQRVARLTLKKKGVLDEAYLVQFLSSTSFRQSLSSVGHGAAQQNVSPTEIGKIKVPFPSLAEQQRIATALDARLEQTGQLHVIYQQKLEALAKLKQAILRKAFAGELTTLSAEAVQEAAE